MLCVTERIYATNLGALRCYQSGFLTGPSVPSTILQPLPWPLPADVEAEDAGVGRPEAQGSSWAARVQTIPGRKPAGELFPFASQMGFPETHLVLYPHTWCYSARNKYSF